jgi:hypothetical protein
MAEIAVSIRTIAPRVFRQEKCAIDKRVATPARRRFQCAALIQIADRSI